jgi:ribosomal protein L11 methyltransferase
VAIRCSVMTGSLDALPSQPPCSELYIYYLEGRLPSRAFVNDDAFIGNWEEGGDSFLFFTQPRNRQVQRFVEQSPQLVSVDHYHMTYAEWQGSLPEPFSVGRLIIMPPWCDGATKPKSGSILLDPGVVFGTGTHPTTHDCLRALQYAFDRCAIGRVLDLGTGTGLLGLAAVRLGAGQCIAVDSNRLAVETALRNVRYNDMLKQVLVVQGDAKKCIDLPCDLMVSNIHYDMMRQLVSAPGFRDIAHFILSGLLRSQALEIERQLGRCGATILHQWTHEGIWHTFYGENA